MPQLFLSSSGPGLGGSGISLGDAVLSIIGIIAILFAAYYVTMLVAKKAGTTQNGRVIKIIERINMSKDKMLCIIEVGGSLYFVALTDGGASLIDKLSLEESDEVRLAIERQSQNSFFSKEKRGRIFGNDFNSVKKRLEKEEKIRFAKEEDDLDAVLRRINANRQDEEDDR